MADNSSTRLCSIEGCGRPLLCKGYCGSHYQLWKRNGDPLVRQHRRFIRGNPEATFWLYVNKSGPVPALHPELGPCWVWTGRTIRGYGQMRWHRTIRYTHIISWFLSHHGEWPTEDTLHRCDNPACVNPGHLFLGTHQDNMRDRNSKGRQARGERQHGAKLTASDVVAIRQARADGKSPADLAAEYGVSRRAIYSATNGDTWSHI